ncbi:MAG: IS3 family transposase [Nocardioidaceae bacterium]
MGSKYSPQTRERVVRLVLDEGGNFRNEFQACQQIADQFGMHRETVRRWVKEARIEAGVVPPDADEKDRLIAELRRENAELEQTVEVLKAATFFLRAGVRPATSVICRFIVEQRGRFGVAPICRALKDHLQLQIAPRTFYAWLHRSPSKRALWETTITEILAGYYEPDEVGHKRPESLYGAVKMWAHLQRQGIPVARCTVERLMRRNGWQGVRRTGKVRTTIPDRDADRAVDLVDRQFTVEAPNLLFVADFTYVRVRTGFVYTAFVIDAFTGTIVGWQVAARATATMVENALAYALETRRRQGRPVEAGAIHHSDAETQYTSISFGKALSDSEVRPSIGSVGDAYDNALAETTIGLYKTECARPDSPFHTGLNTIGDVELATAAWVHWYNTSRLMHRLGRRPPLEAEKQHYDQHADQLVDVHT